MRERLREGILNVGQALREPEEFAQRWNRGEASYRWWVWMALALTAVLGTMTYGMTMGLLGETSGVLGRGVLLTTAAGLAWLIPLPALYILNSLGGSRLPISSTVLAALVTVSWGGLAMIAMVPVNWFFTAAIPVPGMVLVVNLVIFTGVGVAMIDVFAPVMKALEPGRAAAPTWWLLLVAVIGGELYWAFGVFDFAALV